MKRIVILFFVTAFSFFLLSGCQSAQPQPSSPSNNSDDNAKPIQVVTTIFPPYDFVRTIAGDKVEVSMLLSPGAESHSFEPTPQDIILIQNCDLFLYAGGDSDLWVERILNSMDTTDIVLLPLLDMVDAVEEELVEGMEHGHSHDEDDHDNGEHDAEDNHGHDDERELDEHVWTSPKNAMLLVQQIADVLCELDPGNASTYQQNTASYLLELAELDQRFEEMRASAVRSTIVFGDRFPFRYLADAYDLEYYAAFPGCSTDTEASAATVAFLMDKVADEGIPVIFHIELSNERMADVISESTGAKKLLLHSVHNVSRDDFQNGVTYLDLMERNLEHLREALC